MLNDIIAFYSQFVYLGITLAVVIAFVILTMFFFGECDVMNYSMDWPYGLMGLATVVGCALPYFIYRLVINYIPVKFHANVMAKSNHYDVLSLLNSRLFTGIFFGLLFVFLLLFMVVTIYNSLYSDISWRYESGKHLSLSGSRLLLIFFALVILNLYVDYYFINLSMLNYLIFAILSVIVIGIAYQVACFSMLLYFTKASWKYQTPMRLFIERVE